MRSAEFALLAVTLVVAAALIGLVYVSMFAQVACG